MMPLSARKQSKQKEATAKGGDSEDLLAAKRPAAGGAAASGPKVTSGMENGEDLTAGVDQAGRKRKPARNTLREGAVLSSRGLFKLYQEMQKLPLSRKPGNEVRAVLFFVCL